MPPRTTRVVSTARREQGRQLAASLPRDPVTHRFLPRGEDDGRPPPATDEAVTSDPSPPDRRWDPRTQRRRSG